MKKWGERERREAWARVFDLTARSLRMSTEPLRATVPLDPEIVATEDDYAITLRKFSPRFKVDVAAELRRVRRVVKAKP